MRGKGTRRKPAGQRREPPPSNPPVAGMPPTASQSVAPQTREPFMIAMDRPYAIQQAIRAALEADDARLARLGGGEYQLSEDRVRPMIEAAAVVIAEDAREGALNDFAAGFGVLLDELGKGAAGG